MYVYFCAVKDKYNKFNGFVSGKSLNELEFKSDELGLKLFGNLLTKKIIRGNKKNGINK